MIKKIQALINENEEVIGVARIHWIVFIPSAFYTLLAILVAIFFHPLVGGVIFALALYPIYNAFIYYFMTYLVLTNEKVLSRKGFLTRDWIRMEFDRIENSYLEEPIIGRFLGYATIIISGIGSGSIAVPHVRNGDLFVRALEKQLSDNKKK
ncbi:MAG: PH domain-containing protein [Alphaproteobacteria bacterium]|nr:PH domain-containing protein [Alphaproteobacteria bacterium]NCQ88006.1 PH domain-containing protein [Alphaproteobacteria bacterium]NCT05487.1 PH domain-containing protein [Alphaproteobacteria bacterium]